MLDGARGARARKTSRAAAAKSCLALFAALTAVGYALALCLELPHVGHAASIAHHGRPRDTRRLVVGAAAMLCWGFSDSQIQAFVYWLIRVTYGSGPEQARAVGFFKMTQSAGWCIGFAFSPPHRMAPIVQLLATAAVCAVGTALTLPELPAAKLDDEEDYEQLTEEQGQPSDSR